jgi:hypothetical protein
MQKERWKIDAPGPDTPVVGRWTLRQVVSLMDRMSGVFAAVDVPNTGRLVHTVLPWRHHLRIPVGPIADRDGYATRLDTLSRVNAFGFNPASSFPGGVSVWKIEISHHRRKYRSEPWRQPIITSERLAEFCDGGELQYVFVQGLGIEDDLEYVDRSISSAEAQLAVIGPWLDQDLWMNIRCACDKVRCVGARELFGKLPVGLPVAEALSKLRCTECNTAQIQQATPYFANGLTALERYRRGEVENAAPRKFNLPDELHMSVGGDGENPAYLSNNLWIDPDGTIHE